jgi:sarcosine oxidase gamma subunit
VHEPERLPLVHIAARPAALDSAAWPAGAIVLRVAPDEALVLSGATSNPTGDPHAIVELEEGFVAIWMPALRAQELLARTCDWDLPAQRPAFAQGAVAGLPVKLWLEHERVLFLVPAPWSVDFQERIR